MSVTDYVYPPVVRLALGAFRALQMRFIDRGFDNMPTAGGAVVASNHIGYLDFIMVGRPAWYTGRRLVRFMAKIAVFDHKISGPLMRGMHHIPVDRAAGVASYQHAVHALRDGELVGVFPEATISQAFVVKEMKSGAVRMAAEAGVPIVPVVVWGTQRLWTKNRPRKFSKKRCIVTIVGEPYLVSPDVDVAEATQELRQTLQKMLDQAQHLHPDTSNPPDDAWWLPQHLGGTAPSPEEAHAADLIEQARRQAARARETKDRD